MKKQSRRDFLKTTAAVGAVAALGAGSLGVVSCGPERRKGTGGRMKLSWFPYELELQHTFTVASYSRNSTPGVQVRIDYDGLTGYGEASMPPYLGQTVQSVTSFLEKVDLGQFPDPLQMEEILTYVDSLSPGDTAAKAAVDIALHDLVGKIIGQPWYRIWGYDPAKAPSTTFTIGIDTPDVVREKTLECADRFNILKVKVGLDNDEEIFWLHENGVVMVEQPMAVDRLDDIAWITERAPVPIFADESVQRVSDIPRLAGAFSGINIKLMKCTGMREAHKMVDVTRTMGLRVMLGCMTETSCAVSAAAQLSPAVDFADLDGNLLISNDLFKGVEVVKGRLTLPNLPGIGIIPL